jgi:pimeloyl-ACP methyl ester carboxylesterase
MRRGWLEIGAARLETAHFGPERADRCIVLLHEGLGCVAMWRRFPQALAAATGWPIFAWSRIGYGGSSPVSPPRGVTYMHDEATEFVAPVLQAVGASDYILLGHSDGASIAALYAGTHDDSRLRGLVLLAPHFVVEDVTIAGIAQARERYVSGDLRARLAKYHEDVDGAFWGWNGAWLASEFRYWNIAATAENIRVPTLVVQGLADPYGTPAQVAALRAPDVRPVLLPGVGHSPHLEAPEATLEAVTAFVHEVMAPGG